jgi:glutamyl-Q tRNA(Asp) synthetase
MPEYAQPLEDLIARGLAYRCFKTRKQVLVSLAHAPHDSEALYFGTPLPPEEEAERLSRGEMFAWRLWTERVRDALGSAALGFEDETGIVPVDVARLGDVVIARKDFPASYHLACVCDDAAQGVTHVIRGEDLRDSAHVHVVLQRLLGLPTPAYRHHRLIVDAAGKRLAKRDQAVTLRALRAGGMTPADIRAQLGL